MFRGPHTRDVSNACSHAVTDRGPRPRRRKTTTELRHRLRPTAQYAEGVNGTWRLDGGAATSGRHAQKQRPKWLARKTAAPLPVPGPSGCTRHVVAVFTESPSRTTTVVGRVFVDATTTRPFDTRRRTTVVRFRLMSLKRKEREKKRSLLPSSLTWSMRNEWRRLTRPGSIPAYSNHIDRGTAKTTLGILYA